MRALPLIMAICALALMAAPAMAEDVTIPINKDYKSGDMIVHITKVTITDKYEGNTYSADPDNTIWPKVWFSYENKGTTPVNGNLYVGFADDKGIMYWDAKNNRSMVDITMYPIQPGQTSDERFLEVAAPKGTKITQLIIFGPYQKTDMVIDLTGGSTATATTAATGQDGAPSICPSLLLLPLLVLGMAAALRIKR
jgi:MYXO-CTERM domain-containing protein